MALVDLVALVALLEPLRPWLVFCAPVVPGARGSADG